MAYVLTGGFAAGYRTYILAGLGVVTAGVAWAVGDQTSAQTVHTIWEIVLSASVGTARAALAK